MKSLFIQLLIVFITHHLLFAQTQNRKVSSFNKLDLRGMVDVVIENGNTESIRVEAKNVDPSKIITKVSDGTLIVDIEKDEYKNIRTIVYVTFKKIESIEKSGSGNLTCKSDLSAKIFDFDMRGSGNVEVKGSIKGEKVLFKANGSGNVELASIEAKQFSLSLSGSGNLSISSGETIEQSIQLTGSGNIESFGLNSETASIKVSGSGNVDAKVSKSLEGKIAGSGNINYKGGAKVSNFSTVGSGSLNKM